MTNLKPLWIKHLTNTNLLILLLLFSFFGFLDATYLTILHFEHIIPPCSIVKGCETVLTSKYAVVGPIPVALLGSIYYLAIIVLGILFYQKKNAQLFTVITILISFAVVLNLYFFFLQAFVIHAFCQFCLTNEVMILLQVGTVLTIIRHQT